MITHFLQWHGKLVIIAIIVAFAPTDVSDDCMKDVFYYQLQELVRSAPGIDGTAILTDAVSNNGIVSTQSRVLVEAPGYTDIKDT